jgi:hypothetical protein
MAAWQPVDPDPPRGVSPTSVRFSHQDLPIADGPGEASPQVKPMHQRRTECRPAGAHAEEP